MGRLALVLVCAVVGFVSAARADGLDAERFTPAVGAEPGFVFEHPMVPTHLGWGLGLFLDFADDPVIERDRGNGAILSRPLDTAVTADLVGSLGLFGWSEIGLHLPVQLVYSGDGYAAGTSQLAPGGGLGDLRVVPKALLLRTGTADRHVLVGLGAPVSLPTGDAEALRGAGGVTIEPRLLVAGHFHGLGLGANVGYRWRSEHPAGLPWASELALSAMASYELSPDLLTVQAEIFGGKHVGGDVDGADAPVEGLLGLLYQASDAWALHAGAGIGFTDGIGAPDLRVVAGVRFRRGVPKRRGFLDRDGDGILDKDDACPGAAEDLDAFEDEDGCPEDDNDRDQIPDQSDECPDMPEEPGGDGDGCPSETFVKIVGDEMHIFGKVQFKLGSAEIDRRSDALLDQVAAALRANPQVERLRIEGHTDDVGDDRLNQRLSEERAASVKRALVERGIESDRLATRGHGESRPLAPNRSAAGRAKNRRVEFLIVNEG